ncbi:MAG: hypothetical protein EP346_05850 [Bacteroidetes bacterium]|nr:MAG: hypothetical protein EP346_05850 [Bacteroidota bacterium]
MKPLILISLLSIACLTSCKKDEMTTVAEGHVYEVNSTTPIPGAKVYIAREKRYTYGIKFIKLDSTICNENGKFKLSSTSSNIDLVIYTDKKDGYFDMLEDKLNVPELTPGEYNRINVHPIPYAWVRINYDQLDPTHGVYINRITGTGRIDGFSLTSDTSAISRTYGNNDVELSTFYNVSGQQVNHEYISETTGSHDTTEVDISF